MEINSAQQEGWETLRILSNEWEESLKRRSQEYFDTLTSKLKSVEEDTHKIEESFRQISLLKIDKKWNFDYPDMAQYFDKSAVDRFNSKIQKMSKNLKLKVIEEKAKMHARFENSNIFDKMENKIVVEGAKRYGSMMPIDRGLFSILKEGSMKAINEDSSNMK